MVALTDREIMELQDALKAAEELVTPGLFRVVLTREQIDAIIEALDDASSD